MGKTCIYGIATENEIVWVDNDHGVLVCVAAAPIRAGMVVEYRRFRDRTLRKVWPSPVASGYPRWLMWLARCGLWHAPTHAGVAVTDAGKGETVRVRAWGGLNMTGTTGRGVLS